METSDQKNWRLYQFDFMGLRNTSGVLKTTAGEAGGGVRGGGGDVLPLCKTSGPFLKYRNEVK